MLPKRERTQDITCVSNSVKLAKKSIEPTAFDIIANHQLSPSVIPMTLSCLRRFLVRIERGYEAYRWEPKPLRFELSEYDYDYSDNPSLHKFFLSMISSQHIIRFMDNLLVFDADKYLLFKRLLKDTSQGKADQELNVTILDRYIWKAWVAQQIRYLPHFSVESYFFLLDDSKQEILMGYQPSQASLEDLTSEDCSMFNEFFYEDWYKNKLCNVYPKGSTAIQDFINNNSDERFSRMLNIFNAFDRRFNDCFKNILKNSATPEDIQYYEHIVCSFSSLQWHSSQKL